MDAAGMPPVVTIHGIGAGGEGGPSIYFVISGAEDKLHV